jgi:hypothetical protein
MTPTDKQAAVEAALEAVLDAQWQYAYNYHDRGEEGRKEDVRERDEARAALLALLAEPRGEGVALAALREYMEAVEAFNGTGDMLPKLARLEAAKGWASGVLAAAPSPTPTTGEAGVDVIGAIGPLPPPVLTIPLDADQAKELYAFMAAFNDDEFCQLSVHIGDGHSGTGLYVSFTEYPDEGATFIAPLNDSPTPPTRPAQPTHAPMGDEPRGLKLPERPDVERMLGPAYEGEEPAWCLTDIMAMLDAITHADEGNKP